NPSGMLRAHLLSQALLQPVALLVAVALLAWLWAGAMERALARTAAAAAATARYASLDEQQAHLDRGIQALLATLAQVANGQYSARVESGTRTVLWQLATPLNGLITRLAATAQADQQLRATERAIDQLTAALEQAHGGRPPLWPSASGTRADRLTGLLAASAPRALPMPGARAATAPDRAVGVGTAGAAQPGNDVTRPAQPQHRAPAEFVRDGFAQSYPAGPAPSGAHASARRMERNWASHPLPALDTGALSGRRAALRPTGVPQPDARAMPSWLFGGASVPTAPAWEPSAPITPAWADHTAPMAAPVTAAPVTAEGAAAPTLASERTAAPEPEWSASAPEQPAPGVIPPAQAWTIVPLVPAAVERPEWPDFLITLDAVRHEQEGERDE
ncbi:MAG TPA: hypothetical protein VGR57_02225, partial [Ktedonobacterales bacterium]|nr:hypothetical protein [Ktedonobacterales bacterium]